MKRLPLLIRAHTQALRQLAAPASLMLVGGHPGEWEGTHPLTVARALGSEQVFLAGWWPHERLSEAMNAADVFVLPSVAESFGLALVEAMACGLPVVAADACGPAGIVPAAAGWLVPPDDEDALADALADAARDARARSWRGGVAYHAARSRYGWPRIARSVAATYAEAARETQEQLSGSAELTLPRSRTQKGGTQVLELTDDAIDAVKKLTSSSPFGIGAGGVRITSEEASGGVEFQVDVVALSAEDDEVIGQEQARVFLDPETAAMLDEKVLHASIEEDRIAFTIADQI